MNIQGKLTIESILSNFLMYLVVLAGGLAAILVDMVAILWNAAAYSYVPVISSGTMFGAALCHYFVHYGPAYLAKKGEADMIQYEADRSKHHKNNWFVGVTNAGILLIISGVTTHSLINIFQAGEYVWGSVTGVIYVIAILLFVRAPQIAKAGWEKL